MHRSILLIRLIVGLRHKPNSPHTLRPQTADDDKQHKARSSVTFSTDRTPTGYTRFPADFTRLLLHYHLKPVAQRVSHRINKRLIHPCNCMCAFSHCAICNLQVLTVSPISNYANCADTLLVRLENVTTVSQRCTRCSTIKHSGLFMYPPVSVRSPDQLIGSLCEYLMSLVESRSQWLNLLCGIMWRDASKAIWKRSSIRGIN